MARFLETPLLQWVHGSLPGNASAAMGSEAIAPRLQEDFPGDPAETDGSAKGRTAPI